MIGGIIVGPAGMPPCRVLLRAIGPSLGAQDVASPLPDPILELHDSNGGLLAYNDDWRGDQAQEINDTAIPPKDERESAIVGLLNPGNYTAVLRAKNGATGVALVEAFALH